MESVMQAIEVTGMIDAEHHLILDEQLTLEGPTRVRVVILAPKDEEIREKEWLYAAAMNPAFDSLKDASEDIYSLADGRPFHDKG